jgi:hypothetical protein
MVYISESLNHLKSKTDLKWLRGHWKTRHGFCSDFVWLLYLSGIQMYIVVCFRTKRKFFNYVTQFLGIFEPLPFFAT